MFSNPAQLEKTNIFQLEIQYKTNGLKQWNPSKTALRKALDIHIKRAIKKGDDEVKKVVSGYFSIFMEENKQIQNVKEVRIVLKSSHPQESSVVFKVYSFMDMNQERKL